MAAEAPSREVLFNKLKEIIESIPDISAISVKDVRQMAATHFGLPDCLEARRAEVKLLMSAILDGNAMPPEGQAAAAPVPMSYQRAKDSVDGLLLRKLPRPRFVPPTPSICDFGDLPLRDFSATTAKCKVVVDIIAGYTDAVDIESIKQCALDGELEGLPAVCRPPAGAHAVNHCVQMAFVPNDHGTHTVVKHITFESDGIQGTVKGSLAATHQHGTLHFIQYGPNLKTGKKVFQFLFEQLGGLQIRNFALEGVNGVRAQQEPELADIDKGFDEIEQAWREGKVKMAGLCLLRWVTKQVKDPTSSLYNWSPKLVEKAFTKLSSEGCLAKEVQNCPYTLQTFQPYVVNTILKELVPLMGTKALGVIGKAGCGKTPLIEGVACMMSRYLQRLANVQEPGKYRTACDLDFFRGEVGSKFRPDLLDDADPKFITASRWKAFTDVGQIESMSRERWGASKWVRNQLRLFAVNPFDDTLEPETGNTVTHGQFMFILHPMFMKDMDDESKLAVLKRTCLIVVTASFIYWRPAGEKEVNVKRLPLDSDNTANSNKLVRECQGHLVEAWRQGQADTSEDYEDQLAFEEQWMNAIMSKGALTVPVMPNDARRPRVDQALAAEPEMPQLNTGSTKRRKFKFCVKKEKGLLDEEDDLSRQQKARRI